MGVSDARGLLSAPQLNIGGHKLTFAQAPAEAQAPLPLAATLPVAALQGGAKLAFDLKLELAGTGRIGWVPLADENTVTLKSSWPHPSFAGSFLPRTREVGDAGFSATWSVPSLSSQAQAQFVSGFVRTGAKPPEATWPVPATRSAADSASGTNRYRSLEQFSVSLDDPVDVYRLTERATKYGMMFIVLTFAAFFVLEMVKRWRIHPMQYLMIGAALVLFFLLLLSLSEHLSFAAAYAIASGGCITLLSHYLRHVLGSWRAGLGMSGMLVALYGVLYGILISEDNALMMGSLLLFGVLAAIMIATRKLDWYGVMGSGDQPAARRRNPVARSLRPRRLERAGAEHGDLSALCARRRTGHGGRPSNRGLAAHLAGRLVCGDARCRLSAGRVAIRQLQRHLRPSGLHAFTGFCIGRRDSGVPVAQACADWLAPPRWGWPLPGAVHRVPPAARWLDRRGHLQRLVVAAGRCSPLPGVAPGADARCGVVGLGAPGYRGVVVRHTTDAAGQRGHVGASHSAPDAGSGQSQLWPAGSIHRPRRPEWGGPPAE